MRTGGKRAVTFLEIVIAVSILVIALIPLFGMMSRQTVETDMNASEAFAINKASEILNTIIDNMPFATIRQGNPGYIKVSDLKGNKDYAKHDSRWAKKMVKILFPGSKKDSSGYKCQTVISDARGIHYLVHLRVEDVSSVTKAKAQTQKIGERFPDGKPSEFREAKELTFSFLKNPGLIDDGNWIQDYAEKDSSPKPSNELELESGNRGVSVSPTNIYLDEGYQGLPVTTPKFKNPTAVRYYQRGVTTPVPYEVSDDFKYCTMKKLLVQIQWNLEQKYFKTPEVDKGRVQRIHLMTLKGDLD
jgi:hypothetical protein